MGLLSEHDRQTVSRHLTGITEPVTLLFFTQTFGAPETVLIAKEVVDEVASLSDKVTVEEVNAVLDKERMAGFGIDRVPAIALLRNGQDTRMRFVGAPAGYEFSSLVEAIVLAGTKDSGLSDASRALLAERVTSPIDIKVFVTPTCTHCPRMVTLAYRFATEHPLVTATCVEASEFIDLARKYHVTGVPKTIVEGTSVEILGAVPEEQFAAAVLGTATTPPESSAPQ